MVNHNGCSVATGLLAALGLLCPRSHGFLVKPAPGPLTPAQQRGQCSTRPRHVACTVLMAKAGRRKGKDGGPATGATGWAPYDPADVFEEEELEEGIWPVGVPAPWDSDLGALEPFILDAEEYDDDDADVDGGDAKGDEGGEAVDEEQELEDMDFDETEFEGVEQDVDLSVGPLTMDLPASMMNDEVTAFDSLLIERALRFYEHYDGTRDKEKCFLVGVAKKGFRRSNKAVEAEQNYRKASKAAFSDAAAAEQEDEEGSAADEKVDPAMLFTVEESLTELSELVGTAGLEVMGFTYQKVHDFNTRTCIGSGKVREIKNTMAALGCKAVIIDEDLTPSQQMNLEKSFGGEQAGIKVLDRTALILDIFAQHAKTKEGKLQVELALLMYRLPRLTRLWTHLERQSSGGATGTVGLRGPGELQLEVDKRIIRKKIAVLKREISQVQRHRSLHRVRRAKMGYPVVALVGYTNSGKSTLLNSLTRAGALAEDLMFATLDPTTRKLSLPQFQGSFPNILLTDTVGFIQKLPTHLVAAFRATLEEIYMADVLVHVVDVSNPIWKKQKASVDATLEDMGVADKPRIVLYNKVDLLEEDASQLSLPPSLPWEVAVRGSAVTGAGMLELLEALDGALRSIMVHIEAVVPFSAMDVLSQIFDRGSCDKVIYQTDGTYVAAQVPHDLSFKLLEYRVDDEAKAYKAKEEGMEIDWQALAKGRHTYRRLVDDGKIVALSNDGADGAPAPTTSHAVKMATAA